MRKLFLIVMMFLLPHQYAWAMVANYDVHDINQHNTQARQSHFGHHEHNTNSSDIKSHIADEKSSDLDNKDANNQASDNHVHCGFSHLSCGEVLSYSLPIFEATNVQFLSQYSLVYHAPTSNVLDRPKWTQLN